MVQKSAHLIFKKAWTFPKQVEDYITKVVNDEGGKWLHAPVGVSEIGKANTIDGTSVDMLTFDRDPTVNPDLVGDIFDMPFEKGSFDGVISDPVWYSEEKNKTYGLSYDKRRYLSYQVRDILKPGGLWIFNGLWIPEVKGLKVIDPIIVPTPTFTGFRNVSLIVLLRRTNEIL